MLKFTNTLIAFCLIVFVSATKAQNNLVPDGSFELFKNCPFIGGIGLYSVNWFQPTKGSSDLFNVCNTFSNDASVPYNAFGNQIPKTGNGYAGLGLRLVFNSDYKEYLSVGLNKTLEKDHEYKIQLHISLSDSSWIALNEISVLLSTDSLQSLNSISNTIPINPQINFKCSTCFYKDTTDWIKLETIYKATGSEAFITIGNFTPFNLQQILQLKPILNSNDSLRAFNYYYIDDVSLVDVTEEKNKIPNFFTPNGDSVNDVFCFDLTEEIKTTMVFDRWGLKLFETKLQKDFWDGRTISGIECREGVYYYIIETTKNTYRGFIQLIR